MSLLTITQAAPLLGCRDPRTAAKRLAALGVPVLNLYGRRFVEEGEITRAIRAHARPLDAEASTRTAAVRLAPGVRLWDLPAEGKRVGPRRVNGRPRGDRERQAPGRARSLPGVPAGFPRDLPSSRYIRDEEER
jgi:hypothetical protein